MSKIKQLMEHINDVDEQFIDLVKYDEDLADDQPWVGIHKIIVPSEYDKEQLLLAFKYIHDLRCIDTDYLGVNTLIHIYECPEIIEVNSDYKG